MTLPVKSAHLTFNLAPLQQLHHRHTKVVYSHDVDTLELTPYGLHVVCERIGLDLMVSPSHWGHCELAEPLEPPTKRGRPRRPAMEIDAVS